jgi:hypothetical protein
VPSEKQRACNRITEILDMPPQDIDGRMRGTVPKPVFNRAAQLVGVPIGIKEEITESVIRLAGHEWHPHFDSRQTESRGQGNITAAGLWALGDALEALLRDGNGNDGFDAPAEMQDPWLPDGGQRRLADPERRRRIEMAAQDWLMWHFRQDGWDVEDTHIGNPYDAIARKGRQVLYLEAKGTTTNGDSVIVTRNEVIWAREHPDQCILGVWAGMQLDEYGEVTSQSGHRTVQWWNPYDEDLDPIAFDYRMDWNA